MARVDDLINQVKDQQVRRELQAALADLKKRQRFGLVYEEHIPETSSLYGLPVQVGSIVQRRDDTEGKLLWRVTALSGQGRKATIVPIDGKDVASVFTKDLLVVKRFGDPMYATLTSLGTVRRSGDKPFHAAINGENFHALQLMTYLYEGQVDCLYLDPPFNTGAGDWKYNNRYIDANDAWRHSKWLSFMEKRLRLAKRLLKRDGVLIVMVDEHEVHHLGMLLERLFPEYLRYMITLVINRHGGGTGKANFSRVDEYAFFVVPDLGVDLIPEKPGTASTDNAENAIITTLDSEKWFEGSDEEDDKEDDSDEVEEKGSEDERQSQEVKNTDEVWEWRHARRRGAESSYRHQRWHQFYPIFIDEEKQEVVRTGPPIPLDAEPDFTRVDGLRPIWPIDGEGRHRCWAFVSEQMQKRIDAGDLVLGKYNAKRDSWTIKYRVPLKPTRKLKTVWVNRAHDAGTHGTELLRRLLGAPGLFPFPKSVYAVKDCLAAVVRNRPNALIIDFFAGSGTTFHATCLLNAEDGGRRRSIPVTNNEVSRKVAKELSEKGIFRGEAEFERHGIFELVTRPRCEAVVTGCRPDKTPVPGNHLDAEGRSKGRPFAMGFEENIEFYRLDYLDPVEVDLGRQFESILPALWLAAGGIGEREVPSKKADFLVSETSTYGVLFRESRFQKLKEFLKEHPAVTHVWFVTDSEEAYAEMRIELPRRIHTSMLYRDYLRNFQINTEGSL